jgi:hypothetical protein
MAYVPGFENDVFISFGHIDNETPSKDWVTELHAYIQGKLRQTCNAEVQVWRDLRLDGQDRLEPTLQTEIARSAMFVSVLSPGYAQSPWCSSEVAWFLSANQFDVSVDNKSRIARIVKSPLLDVPWPAGLEDGTLHYRFFDKDKQSGRVREFSAWPASPTRNDFNNMCDEVTQGIAGVLRRMRRLRAPVGPAGPAAKVVFLADVTSDVREARKCVMAELRDRNCQVVEASATSDRPAAESAQQTAASADKADLTVHILGRYRGVIPEASSESIVEMQIRVVREARATRAAARPLLQLLWCPDIDADRDAELEKLLGQLEATETDSHSIEIIRGPLSKFKEALLDILSRRAVEADPAPHTRSVFLLCHRHDIADPELLQIRSWFLEQGYPADLPVYQGDMAKLLQAEEENILECNATVIFYGSAEDAWVREKRRSVQKVWAKQPMADGRRRAVYLARPEDDLKQAQYLKVPNRVVREKDSFPPLLVLGDCGPFDPEKLAPLTDGPR